MSVSIFKIQNKELAVTSTDCCNEVRFEDVDFLTLIMICNNQEEAVKYLEDLKLQCSNSESDYKNCKGVYVILPSFEI